MSWPGLVVGVAALSLSACVSTSVDYSELKSAARARQGAAAAPSNRDVNRLLANPLTAESAAEIALLNNRGARAAIEELAVARAELAAARRLPNPTLEGAARFGGGHDPELEIGAMLDVTELLLALPRGSAASSAVDAAELAAIGTILDLSFGAREAFFDYQAAAQSLELRATVVQALGAAAELAQKLEEAGNITELQSANEQSAFHEARLEHQRAELETAAARERLNSVLGLWGRGTEWRAAPRLPELPAQELSVETLEAEAIRRSLDLSIAKHRFASAAKYANATKAGAWLPELKAGVSAERDEEWAVGPAVEVEVPLFYQGQGEVAAANARVRQQQNLYTDLAVRIRAEARTAGTRLRAARDAAVYYRDVLLPLKQRVVEETQLQYNAMALGAFQLLQAKRDQVVTANAYIDRLREYWLARTAVERLLAGRLGSSSVEASAGLSSTESAPRAQAH